MGKDFDELSFKQRHECREKRENRGATWEKTLQVRAAQAWRGRGQRTGSGTRGEARSQIPPSLVRSGKSLGFHSKRARMLEVLRGKVISSDICFIRTTLAALWEQNVGDQGRSLKTI